MIHRLVGLVAFVAAGIAIPVATASVHSASLENTPCLDNVGVTIVVDFHELGGGVNIRCAPGPVTSGLDALDKAGIVWESVRRFPGFVCRIAGLPGPDTEACINTPPATAYWSYWVAPRGGSWCYSSRGPGARVPPPGTVEGWSFSLGKVGADTPPPSTPPPPPIDGEPPNPLSGSDCGKPAGPSPVTTTAAPAETPPPVTTTAAPPQPTPPPPTAPAVASQGATPTTSKAVAIPSTTVAVAVNSPTSSTTSSPPTAVTTTSTSVPQSTVESSDTSASASPTDGDTVASEAALGTVDLSDDGRGSGGFSPATAIGIVAAAGLGGAGVWAARRRRAVT